MKTGWKRLAVVVALIAAAFVAFGCGDDEDSTTESTTTEKSTAAEATTTTEAAGIPTIEIVNGEPEGGVAELEFDKGDQIEFKVVSDTASEVHVHGYDVMEDVEAGGSVRLSFAAEIDGVFEIELEDTKTEIAELRVNP